jgi:beta-N-acetylhexosaminidase
MGQLFMMGFDGTSVSPQVRSLIEDYHLGSILLSAKNLKCNPVLFSPLRVS